VMSSAVGDLGAPEHLTSAHDVSDFDCGVPGLNNGLKKERWPMRNPARRVFMSCGPPARSWGTSRWRAEA
jgi:hypothetical protein